MTTRFKTLKEREPINCFEDLAQLEGQIVSCRGDKFVGEGNGYITVNDDDILRFEGVLVKDGDHYVVNATAGATTIGDSVSVERFANKVGHINPFTPFVIDRDNFLLRKVKEVGGRVEEEPGPRLDLSADFAALERIERYIKSRRADLGQVIDDVIALRTGDSEELKKIQTPMVDFSRFLREETLPGGLGFVPPSPSRFELLSNSLLPQEKLDPNQSPSRLILKKIEWPKWAEEFLGKPAPNFKPLHKGLLDDLENSDGSPDAPKNPDKEK